MHLSFMKLLAPTELPPLWHDLIINPLMKNLLMNFFPKNVCPPMKSFFNFEKITPPPPPQPPLNFSGEDTPWILIILLLLFLTRPFQ